MMNLLSWYAPKLPTYLVYMLQQVNYRAPKFVEWLKRNPNLRAVMRRRDLEKTQAAKLLLGFTTTTLIICVAIGAALIFLGSSLFLQIMGFATIIAAPFITGLALTLAVYIAHIFIASPKEKSLMKESERIFTVHSGIKIGVAGSYGKTTFKEIITTVLAEKLKVAVTPGNMNTPIAHARFASKLEGDEDVLVLEYGEEYPGDTKRFIKTTKPDYAVLMGLAPNHLDYYHTLDALAEDLLELRALGDNLLINGESQLLKKYLKKEDAVITAHQAGEWKVGDVKVDITGTCFTMSQKSRKLFLKSGLLGRHQVATLAIAVLLADQLGLSKQQIEAGIAKTVPFEHRMQPRHMGGATILDDSYNGNVEGILAGLDLLSELKAKRKIYITPGLVDQGGETQTVHHKIAKKLFDVSPDLIVLMDNSATRIIEEALAKLNYQGLIQVESDPLNFYQNIDKIVAAGDIIMMQNDWTDNYN